jgi:hypothetical protein
VQLAPSRLATFPGRVTPGINRGYNTLDKDGKLMSVTAACGPVIYRGGLFPEEFRGDAFIAEPSGNLIKRIKLTEKDGAIKGSNAYEGTEFLVSTDERFRPVNLFNGPDGALYVVDLYRGILQHRTYVTSFLRKQIEERKLGDGIGLGRIWRIVPDGAPKANFKSGLATATTEQLVEKLNDASGWTRDTAQRLLVEKRDPAAAGALRKVAAIRRGESARRGCTRCGRSTGWARSTNRRCSRRSPTKMGEWSPERSVWRKNFSSRRWTRKSSRGSRRSRRGRSRRCASSWPSRSARRRRRRPRRRCGRC